ncbi:MAG TPA: chemotaxis protein CheB [Blastocatellia bacterium]|nr:chemotaxis protein CheB [Blastocatellia bacterium]
MPHRDIIVIGTSMGGIEALKTLVSGLPPDLPASILIVLHVSPESPGILPGILNRAGRLPASNATDREPVVPGRIYVAPPDRHLLVERDLVRVTYGPKENRFRPAIDPLFRSAARAYGPRVIGVILTGLLDDGTAGLWAIKQRGGTAVVQDPLDALAPSMPRSALSHVKVDYCLPLREIASLLSRLVGTLAEAEGEYPVSEELRIEVSIAEENNAIEAGVLKMSSPSIFTCPECHGALLQISEGDRFRFRCHTGHAFSHESLLAELNGKIEDALWNAIRTIQESAMLMEHLARHLSQQHRAEAAAALAMGAHEAQRRADLVRQATRTQPGQNEDLADEIPVGPGN